jgi:hypothetical protein
MNNPHTCVSMRNWIQFISANDVHLPLLVLAFPKSHDTQYLCLTAYSPITTTVLSLQGCKISTTCRPTTSRLRWSSDVTSIRWPRLSRRNGKTTRTHSSNTCGRYWDNLYAIHRTVHFTNGVMKIKTHLPMSDEEKYTDFEGQFCC